MKDVAKHAAYLDNLALRQLPLLDECGHVREQELRDLLVRYGLSGLGLYNVSKRLYHVVLSDRRGIGTRRCVGHGV